MNFYAFCIASIIAGGAFIELGYAEDPLIFGVLALLWGGVLYHLWRLAVEVWRKARQHPGPAVGTVIFGSLFSWPPLYASDGMLETTTGVSVTGIIFFPTTGVYYMAVLYMLRHAFRRACSEQEVSRKREEDSRKRTEAKAAAERKRAEQQRAQDELEKPFLARLQAVNAVLAEFYLPRVTVCHITGDDGIIRASFLDPETTRMPSVATPVTWEYHLARLEARTAGLAWLLRSQDYDPSVVPPVQAGASPA